MASKKTVTPDNLATLGVERPAVILVDLADADAEIKRRLRLELAVLSAVASLAKQDDGQHVAQAACRMPSAMRAAVANLERRVAAETGWL